jgi:predicted transcriptional regulator
MEIHFTPEIAAKLTHSAAEKGRNPDEFVQDVLAQYLEDEARFIEAVKRGENALQRGDYLTHEQVGKRLERFLHT